MTKRTLADYPVEFFDLWGLAAIDQLNLPFEERGTAFNFRHRMHAFRKRLREESPHLNPEFSLADIAMPIEENGMWYLRSHIPGWKKALRQKITELKKTEAGQGAAKAFVPSEGESPPVKEEDHLSSALRNLGFSSGVE